MCLQKYKLFLNFARKLQNMMQKMYQKYVFNKYIL